MSERALVAVVATTVALVAGGGMVAASIAASDGDGDAGSAATNVQAVETVAPGSLGISARTPSTVVSADSTALAALVPLPTAPPATTPAATAAPATVVEIESATTVATTLPAPPTTPSGPPARFRISTTTLDLGAGETTAAFTFVNVGGRAVDWRVEGDPAPFAVAGGVGTLTPGQGASVAVVLDRTNLTEGDYATTLVLTGTTPTEIHVSGRVERPPVVTMLGEPSPATQEVCEPHEVTIVVQAADESGVASVTADLTGPAGIARVELVQDGPWFLHVVPPSVVGDWTVDVVAADVRGNRASLTTGFAVVPCSEGRTQSPLA